MMTDKGAYHDAVEEAQRLVDEGAVNLYAPKAPYIRAGVHSGDKLYYTTLYDDGTFRCTCDWGQLRSYTNRLCAHALAAKLAVEREGTR